METKNLQELLKQLSQERGNAVELKKKKEQGFREKIEKGLKEFIEDFRRNFYPLTYDKEIDPRSMGSINFESLIICTSRSICPTNICLKFNSINGGIDRHFCLMIKGFMFEGKIFEEDTNNIKEEIKLNKFSDYDLEKYGKKLYETFVENKEETINEIYKIIHNNILHYNQKTLEIMEGLK